MNAWEFLIDLNKVCNFQTREGKKFGTASNSELKRWCQNKAIVINGVRVNWDQEINFPINSFILLPKNLVTLF